VPTSRILSPEKTFRWLAVVLGGTAGEAGFALAAVGFAWLDCREAVAVGLKNLRQPRGRFVTAL